MYTIILAITFAIDVLYFHKFYYFFKFLPLLIILLLYEYLLYCITTVAKTNLQLHANSFTISAPIDNTIKEITLAEYVILKWRESTSNPFEAHKYYTTEYLLNENLTKYHFNFSKDFIKDEIQIADLPLNEQNDILIHFYIQVHKVILYPEFFYQYLNIFKTNLHGPKVTCFTSILYLVSWSYIILYGIGYI